MGYNTTILILNDGLGEIERHPELFVQGILAKISTGGDVPVGNHANPVHVMKTEHADVPRLYFTYGNSITEFCTYNQELLVRVKSSDWLLNHYLNDVKIARRLLTSFEKELKVIKNEKSTNDS